MTRLRILYVVRFDTGGSITGLYEALKALSRHRFEPVVLFYRENRYCDAFRSIGVDVAVLRDGNRQDVRVEPDRRRRWLHKLATTSRSTAEVRALLRRDWPLAKRISAFIDDRGIDLVHHNDNLRAHRASIMAGALRRVPQVCHVRSLTEYCRPVDLLLARRVDRFVFMSVAIANQCLSRLSIPPSKGQVIYDPFDLDQYSIQPDEAVRTRTNLGLSASDFLATNVGRLVPWKGQDVFLRSVAKVAPDWPQLKALVVGEPEDSSSSREYARRLEMLVSELRLENRVFFTGHRDDVPAVLNASDVVVHSASRPEPFGRVVVEAMAARKPIIATAAGGVLEILDDGVTGLLVQPGHVVEMAAALRRLIVDRDLCRRLGRQARGMAEKRYDARQQVRELESVYEGLVE
jgi:glycosyltransferase involved in cell wall biosynthesis